MDSNKEKISWREAYFLNKRALRIMFRESPMLFVSTGIHSAVCALVPYLTLYFTAQLLNELAGARREQILIRQVILLLAAEAVCLTLKAVLSRWKGALSGSLYYLGQRRFSNKLLSMDFGRVDDTSTYDLFSQIQQTESWSGFGINRIYDYFQSFLEEFFRMAGGVALSVPLFMLQVDGEAGWLTVLNNPLCILLLAFAMIGVTVLSPYLETLGGMCWQSYGSTMELGNRIYFFCMDLFQEEKKALDIRTYRQDVYALKWHQKSLDSMMGPKSKIAREARGKMGGLFGLAAAVSRIFMGIVYLFVCLKAWGGAFGVGSVAQYVGAVTALSRGLAGMLRVVGEARINSSALKRIFEFLDIPNDMYQGSLTVEKRSDRKYEVEFRNVSFRYPHSQHDVLRNVSLKFKVGQRLAVVGPNGSGKTTFIKLLCRLYDPTEGEILLNGIDIRKYDYREYMNVFSVVFQDFQLLSMPLGENVAAGENLERQNAMYRKRKRRRHADGESGYNRKKALECIEKAGLLQWTASLPKGLDTVLYRDFDEEGVKVSGGEAQKIAIARSLYHDAPFIILDEPTAALDPVAEYGIYTKFNEIVGDRTAIYISHRLSSCRFCDEIVVFHEGNIVQQGSHEELLADREGKYCELWNAQAQYYTGS